MAIWGEIKKAINSNLDKPLNELIIEKSAVKSVQRGVITMNSGSKSGTATIAPVNTTKSVVLYSGDTTTEGGNPYASTSHVQLVLTNSSTVTVSRIMESYGDMTIPYQVIEFY